MATFEFVPAVPEHAANWKGRHRDELEAEAFLGMSARAATEYSIRQSLLAWTGLYRGAPACCWGIRSLDLIGGHGEVWFAGTDLVDRHPIAFARASRAKLAELLEMFPHLANFCDARYEASLRWLRWLGFEVADPKPYGQAGALFCHFRTGPHA